MNYEVAQEKGFSDYFYTSRRTNLLGYPHVHSHIEFIFCLEGALSLTVNEKTITLTADQVAVIMPYQIHHYKTPLHSDAFIIACPPEYISDYRQIFQEQVFVPFQTAFSPITRQLIHEIVLSKEQDYLKNKSLIYYTLAGFVANCSLVKKEPFEYDVYRRAIMFISSHYTENITLEDVAHYTAVTPVHLSRVLNTRGKSSFSDIVNSLRIYEAKRMLEQTSLPISAVAFEIGYGSIRNFNRIFQKYFGCSPSNIRSQ